MPKTVLTDRMGCLKARTCWCYPHLTMRASHPYKFPSDFYQAADPESKGRVERLVGYQAVA